MKLNIDKFDGSLKDFFREQFINSKELKIRIKNNTILLNNKPISLDMLDRKLIHASEAGEFLFNNSKFADDLMLLSYITDIKFLDMFDEEDNEKIGIYSYVCKSMHLLKISKIKYFIIVFDDK